MCHIDRTGLNRRYHRFAVNKTVHYHRIGLGGINFGTIFTNLQRQVIYRPAQNRLAGNLDYIAVLLGLDIHISRQPGVQFVYVGRKQYLCLIVFCTA